MRTAKIKMIFFLMLLAVFCIRCDRDRYGCTDREALNYDWEADIDDGSCYYEEDPIDDPDSDCDEAYEGNLVINNHTGEVLYLYRDYTAEEFSSNTFVTCIPDDTSDFLVYIPNPELSVILLQIWKAGDAGNQYSPDLSKVYRQWRVALSNSTEPDERATWLITGADDYAGTGTLLITYPDIDEYGHPVIYQVDILLNSKSGAKLASLQPGITDKKVSIDYGVHYLYYHYWYSDPNSSSADITDIGWSEQPEIVINEYHRDANIEIPVYYSTIGKYGEITMVNENDFVINVFAGGKLIEDIAVVDGSPQGLSSIPSHSQTTFLIPVAKYNISTKNLAGNEQDQFTNVQVMQDEETILRSGVLKKTIQVINNSDLVLGLFSQDEEFLGLTIEPGKTSPAYAVSYDYDTLKVIDFARTAVKKFAYSSTVHIDELDEYLVNHLNVLVPWPADSGIYTSPEISHLQSTQMEAQLVNAETVVLSFEFNVSSEESYDYFSFFADDFVEIDRTSGESGWVTFSKTFYPGTHNLVWKYVKDHTRSEGRDNVRIKSIQINK